MSEQVIFNDDHTTTDDVKEMEKLSRPAYQRFELGPLLAAITPELLEVADKYANEFLPSPAVLFEGNYFTQGTLIRTFGNLAQKSANVWSSAANKERSDYGVSLTHHLEQMAIKHYPNSTYNGLPESLMGEGLRSGFIMPIRMYGVLQYKGYIKVDTKSRTGGDFDSTQFCEVLRSGWFKRILHNLAYLPNGLLANWSTQADTPGLIDPKHVPELVRKMVFVKTQDGLVLDAATQDAFKQTFVDRNNVLRDPDLTSEGAREYGLSGGCPVRHRTYTKIGPLATAAFEENEFDVAQLANPERQTSIELCADYVARKVEEIAAK